MIKYIFITIFMMVFMGGCSSVTPAVTEYKITSSELESSIKHDGCKDKSLKIAQAFSSNSLMSLDMNYAQGDEKVYAYTQAKWQNSPNQIVTAEVLRVVRASKIFKTTLNSKSRSSSKLMLEINIEEFMQEYSQDLTSSSSLVAISFALVDTLSNEVVTSKTFRVKKDTLSLDAQGGVMALNSALEELLAHLVRYLDGECK